MSYQNFQWTVQHLQQCLASAELVDAAFATADADGDGVVSPFEAPAFFRPSGLPEHVLSKIWRLSAPQNALRSPGQLRVALHMAYDALQGRPLPDVVEQPVSPSAAAAAAAAAAGSGGLPSAQQQPQPPGSAERAAPLSMMEVEAQIAKFKTPEGVAADITPQEAAKYQTHFERAKAGGSWVELSQARDYFAKANLQDDAIERVMRFGTGSHKEMLGRGDFFVVIHIIYTAHRDRLQVAAPAASVSPAATMRERAFSLTPSRLSAVSTDQLSPPQPETAMMVKTRSFPEPGGQVGHRRGASADFPSGTAASGGADPRIRALEEELERQKARLKEAGELRAEAQEVGDAELIEEATQAEQRIEAGVKQREAELARPKAPPQPAGSVAQALSLRERLKKLQAAEAQRTAGGAPLTKQSSVASEAAGTSDDDFTFSPVQGASPAGTPRSGPISPRFGSLTRQLSDTSDYQVVGRHRRHRSASGNVEGFMRPSRPAPRPPSAPVPGPGESASFQDATKFAEAAAAPSAAVAAVGAAATAGWATFGDHPASAAPSQSKEVPPAPAAPHMPPESAAPARPTAASGVLAESDAPAGAADAQAAAPAAAHLPAESAAPAVVEAGANGDGAAVTPAAEEAAEEAIDAGSAPAAPHMPPGSAAPAVPAGNSEAPPELPAVEVAAAVSQDDKSTIEPAAEAVVDPAAETGGGAQPTSSAPALPHMPEESAAPAVQQPTAPAESASRQPTTEGGARDATAAPALPHMPDDSAAPATQQSPKSAEPQPLQTPTEGGARDPSSAPALAHMPDDSAAPAVQQSPKSAGSESLQTPTEGGARDPSSAPALAHMPDDSAVPAAPSTTGQAMAMEAPAETAADSRTLSAAAQQEPGANNNGTTAPLETSASVADAADAAMLGEDIPVPDTIPEAADEAPEAGTAAVTADAAVPATGSAAAAAPAAATTPPQPPPPLHSVPVSQPQGVPLPGMEHAHSRALSLAESGLPGSEAAATDIVPTAAEATQPAAPADPQPAAAGGVSDAAITDASAGAATAGIAAMKVPREGSGVEHIAEAVASAARGFGTLTASPAASPVTSPVRRDAPSGLLSSSTREATDAATYAAADAAAEELSQEPPSGTLGESPAALPGILETGQAGADSAAAAALPDAGQVQEAITDAAQPVQPPPTSAGAVQHAAAADAAPTGAQQRSLKTPSATDLVQAGGDTGGNGAGGSGAGAASAAFPFPSVEAADGTSAGAVSAPPPVANAGAESAPAAGSGWATFDSAPALPKPIATGPGAAPSPATAGGELSKGFGSYEEFASDQQQPLFGAQRSPSQQQPPQRVPYVTYPGPPSDYGSRPSAEVPVSVAQAVLPADDEQPSTLQPAAVSAPSSFDAFAAPTPASAPPASPPKPEAPAPGSTAAAREWPGQRSPPPLPSPPAEDVFGALLPAEFLARRQASPPTSPGTRGSASPRAPAAGAVALGAAATAAAAAAATATAASPAAEAGEGEGGGADAAAAPGDGTTVMTAGGGGSARDALALPDPDPTPVATAAEAAQPPAAAAETVEGGSTGAAAGGEAGPEFAAAPQPAALLPPAASVGGGLAEADAARAPSEQLQPLVPGLAASAAPQPFTSNPFQELDSSSTAPASQPFSGAAMPLDWSTFSAPAAAPQMQMQPYGGGPVAQQQQQPPWGAPLQIEAPPAAGAATAAAIDSSWFDFGGAPADAAAGSSSSTALVPVGGGFLANSGFTPGGQTAPAGWASFDDAAFPQPAPAAATAPAGSFGDATFGSSNAAEIVQPDKSPASALQAPADGAAQRDRAVRQTDSFNIASVLTPSASATVPDLLSDRPPSPVAEFGMPADTGEPDLSSFTPLKAEDHQRCGMAYTMKGYGDRNGAAQEEAWQLWGKAGLTDNFPQAWALSDVDRDGRLNEQEFAVFMWLLKSAKKGLPIPTKPLAADQLRQFTGYSGTSSPTSRLEYQGSISFGDSSQKTAAAAAAAQKAMQEQELAELVSLGFDEADAKAALEANDWNLQPAASALLTQREANAAAVAAQADYLRTPSGKLKPIAVPRKSPGASPSRTPDRSPRRRTSATGMLRRVSNAATGGLHSRQSSVASATALPAGGDSAAAAEQASRSSVPGTPTAGRADGSITAGATAVAITGDGAVLSVKLERAKVVYKKALDRPFCTLSLLSPDGSQLEPPSDTPPGTFDRSSYTISLDHQLRLRTPIVAIPADANVVVEIKHWKSKEKKFSLLAWTFLPAHVLITRADATGNGGSARPPTVNAGPCALPLFAKPMDPTAKKSKPLNAGAPDLLLSIGVEQA